MPRSAFEPCIPTKATQVPDRPEWIHEIKHDGYRLIVQREAKRVRLFTRNGHDWSDRFPLISEAALRNRNSSFVIDGEAVLLGVDGRSDFNGLHSRKHNHEVELYAFDMLVSDGEDLRRLLLSLRKTNLARLLARRVDGIFLSDFEQGEIGPDLFRHACLIGLEGLVSKHRDSAYRGGRSDRWIKVKNRRTPTADVALEITNQVIQFMGGCAAEKLVLRGKPLPALDDYRQARELAAVICTSSKSIERFLKFCEQQAEDLLRPHIDLIFALLPVLRVRRTLTGAEVDEAIAIVLRNFDRSAERERRRDWERCLENAKTFRGE